MKHTEDAVRHITRLHETLERERRALMDFSLHELAAIDIRKSRLLKSLESSMDALTPSQRNFLQEKFLRLRRLAAQNIERLQSMKAAVSAARERLTATRQSSATLGVYSMNGRQLKGPNSSAVTRSF